MFKIKDSLQKKYIALKKELTIFKDAKMQIKQWKCFIHTTIILASMHIHIVLL